MKLDNLSIEEVKSAFDGFATQFGEFKTDNDGRHAETHDRIDNLETLLKRTPRGGNHDQAELERKQWGDWYSARKAELIHGDDVDMDEAKEYAKAFSFYLRKSLDPSGAALGPDIQKALSVGIDPDGGFWVPPAISSRIATRLFETSPIRSIAAIETIGTDALEMPVDSNDIVTGGWVGEKDTRPETDTPQTGMLRIPVHEQFANPRATQKLLDDASFNVENWLANKIADKLVREENLAFVTGNGVAKPKGFLDYGAAATTQDDNARSWGVLQYVASGNGTDFDLGNDPGDELIDLVHKLKAVYRQGAVWVMNRSTVASVRKFKDGQGNYLWARGDLQNQQPASLLGFPIVEAEDMPDVAADAFPIAFGNFQQGYQIVDRQGIRTLRDPFTAKPFVQFYTTKRVGADMIGFDAIKLLKIAAS